MDHAMIPQEWDQRFGSIWAELQRLCDLSGAATAVLLDTSGNAVTYSGEDPEFDLSSFASLAVADFLAMQELSVLMGESALRWVVHQGEQGGLVLAPLRPPLLLGVLFDRRTTLGLVRHRMRKEQSRLEAATFPLLHLLEKRIEAEREDAEVSDGLTDEAVATELQHLFGAPA